MGVAHAISRRTFLAVTEGVPCEPDEIISIDPGLSELSALAMELSQPTFTINGVGKILINKAPDGTKSPNLADAVMIAYPPIDTVMSIWRRLADD